MSDDTNTSTLAEDAPIVFQFAADDGVYMGAINIQDKDNPTLDMWHVPSRVRSLQSDKVTCVAEGLTEYEGVLKQLATLLKGKDLIPEAEKPKQKKRAPSKAAPKKSSKGASKSTPKKSTATTKKQSKSTASK